MSEKTYKRDIIDEIAKYIGTDNIIVLHGSRQVGKTHILLYLQKMLGAKNEQTIYFDLEDATQVEMLDTGVSPFLKYLKEEGIDLKRKVYVFIDEIQYLENPSPFLKLIIDHQKQIQLIVSGSSSFNIKKKFSDTLVGRTVDFEIFPLSFAEYLRFKEIQIDLKTESEFHKERLKEHYQEYVLYGGYPKIVLEESIEKKEKYLGQIVNTYLKKDIRDLAEIKQIKKFNNMLRILASQSGNLLNIAEIGKVCGLARETVENYLFILENTYIIKLLPVFSQSMRVEVVKTPKIFFYDTGLMQILWLKGLTGNILGNMFETSVFSEMVKKIGGEFVYFWRTKKGQEIDFIFNKKGQILPIEAKINFHQANAETLHSFCQKYDISAFKIVGLKGEKRSISDIFPWEI